MARQFAANSALVLPDSDTHCPSRVGYTPVGAAYWLVLPERPWLSPSRSYLIGRNSISLSMASVSDRSISSPGASGWAARFHSAVITPRAPNRPPIESPMG